MSHAVRSSGCRRVALPVALFLGCWLVAGTSAADRAYAPDAAIERYLETHHVEASGADRETQEMLIRVETTAGIASEGTQKIEYRKSVDVVEALEAWLVRPDGTRQVLPNSAIRTQAEAAQDGEAQFTDTEYRVIVYPNVEVGSRLGYRVRIHHTSAVFPGLFWTSMSLHRDYAYEHWQIDVHLPQGMPLYVEQRGVGGGKRVSRDGEDHYRFVYARTTARPSDAGGVSAMDDDDLLRFSTYPDARAIGLAYQLASAPRATVTPAIRKLARELTATLPDDRARVEALHRWVAKNIRYVAVFIGHGGLVPHSAAEVLAKRYGDCKDHAVLMQSLLSAIGIQSSAALVNLGDSYTLAAVGTIDPANHVITYVPTLDLYVDSTDSASSFGHLSFDVMDKPTVLTALDRIGRTPRMLAADNTESATLRLRIHEDGSIEGTTAATFTGTFAADGRITRYNDSGLTEQTVVKNLLSRFNETGVGDLDHPDPIAIEQAFWWKSHYRLDPQTNFPGPGAMKVPVGLSPASIELEAIDKPALVRYSSYPCQSRLISSMTQMEFPESVEVTAIPKDVRYQAPGLHYEASYQLAGRTLTVARRFEEQHDGDVCDLETHGQWVAFHAVLQRDLRSQVVYR